MRKTLLLTATLAFVNTAALAGTSASLQKTQFSFENTTNHSITVEVFDFNGAWANPIPRHFKVTLAPHDIKPVSFYRNTLLSTDGFAGIQLSNANATNDNVTINSFYNGGAKIIVSSGKLVEETHVSNSRVSGEEQVDISFWK